MLGDTSIPLRRCKSNPQTPAPPHAAPLYLRRSAVSQGQRSPPAAAPDVGSAALLSTTAWGTPPLKPPREEPEEAINSKLPPKTPPFVIPHASQPA